jgi:hypothetical protein
MCKDQMLARIARAIAGAQQTPDWRTAPPAARAALAAMREPAVPMLEAALADLPDCSSLPSAWRAMIDYAAGESLQ